MKKAKYLQRKSDGSVYLRSGMRSEDGRPILVRLDGPLKKQGHAIRWRAGEFRTWKGTIGLKHD